MWVVWCALLVLHRVVVRKTVDECIEEVTHLVTD